MAKILKEQPQNPLILRCHRLMEAFAKSDDERDFFLDRMEGFIVYLDLDKSLEELEGLELELKKNNDRYAMIPKLTFYETKKIMEGFINEKVYDIDTKEKLLEIIQSKEARENFLEFIYDHHSELEKWQQYYLERSRIRIIEWLRQNQFEFVFEEDLDIPRDVIEKLKKSLFDLKPNKDIANARKSLFIKAKSYYSNEALNPRPKRGRPPKQIAKAEIEPQVGTDIFTTVPNSARPFLFLPEFTGAASLSFSTRFETETQMLERRQIAADAEELSADSINQKLTALRSLASRWMQEEEERKNPKGKISDELKESFDEEEEEEDDEEFINNKKSVKAPVKSTAKPVVKPAAKKADPIKKAVPPLNKKPLPALKTKNAAPKNETPKNAVAKKASKPIAKKNVVQKKIMPKKKGR